jgi:hypothetical protein
MENEWFAWKGNSDQNISLEVCKLGQNNVAENDEVILSIPYTGLVTSTTM